MKKEKEYYGDFADCYVLTEKRTQEWIVRFLNEFIPNRKQQANEYEIPLYSTHPTFVFKKDEELIDYLEKNKNIPHTIYWTNEEDSDLRGVMVFFTNDGYLIPGIYCETLANDTSIEDNYFNQLKLFWKTDQGYITYEQPAPHNKDEFLKIVNSLIK